MGFAFQLYSSRNTARQTDFLTTLAELGYTQVEGYGGVYDDPESFAAAMQSAGVSMPSGHFALDALREDFDGVMSLADKLGVHHVIVPYLNAEVRPSDAAGWLALAAELEALAVRVAAQGKKLSWHNHDFEFTALADGQLPMTLLLEGAPSIGWEADLAWIVRAGLAPDAYIAKHADRLVAAHVKDIAPAGQCVDEDGWSDVGNGTMPWGNLLEQLRRLAPNAALVVEHDNPSDPERFARVSIENLKGM